MSFSFTHFVKIIKSFKISLSFFCGWIQSMLFLDPHTLSLSSIIHLVDFDIFFGFNTTTQQNQKFFDQKKFSKSVVSISTPTIGEAHLPHIIRLVGQERDGFSIIAVHSFDRVFIDLIELKGSTLHTALPYSLVSLPPLPPPDAHPSPPLDFEVIHATVNSDRTIVALTIKSLATPTTYETFALSVSDSSARRIPLIARSQTMQSVQYLYDSPGSIKVSHFLTSVAKESINIFSISYSVSRSSFAAFSLSVTSKIQAAKSAKDEGCIIGQHAWMHLDLRTFT